MNYWGEVLKRAIEEVRAETPFVTPMRVALWLSPLIGGLLAMVFFHGLGVAPPYAATLSALLAIVVALVAIVWKLASIPPKLAAEAANNADTERLNLNQRIEALEVQIGVAQASLPPTFRDASTDDAIWSNTSIVARIVAPRLQGNELHCEMMRGALTVGQEYRFGPFRIRYLGSGVTMSAGSPMNMETTFGNVRFEIVKRYTLWADVRD